MHHLKRGNTPTEMVHRGPAKPIAIIIIIAVIIIFITVSRVSYYPPPCFLIAKSKVLLCQPYKSGMEPRCHIDMRRAFFIWQFALFTPSVWKEGALPAGSEDEP